MLTLTAPIHGSGDTLILLPDVVSVSDSQHPAELICSTPLGPDIHPILVVPYSGAHLMPGSPCYDTFAGMHDVDRNLWSRTRCAIEKRDLRLARCLDKRECSSMLRTRWAYLKRLDFGPATAGFLGGG